MEIDELSIVVRGDISDVQDKLNKLSGMMKNLGNVVSGKSSSSPIAKVSQNVTKDVKKITTDLEAYRNKVKDLSKDWKFNGSIESARLYLKNFERQLQTAKEKLEDLEVDGKSGNSAWETYTKTVARLTNKIDILKNKLNETKVDSNEIYPITSYKDNRLSKEEEAYQDKKEQEYMREYEAYIKQLREQEKISEESQKELKSIKENNQELEKTVSIRSKLKELFPYSFKELREELKARKEENSLNRGLEKGTIVPTEEYSNLQVEIDKAKEKLSSLNQKMEDNKSISENYTNTKGYKKLQLEIDRTKTKIRELEDEQDRLELAGMRFEKAPKTNRFADYISSIKANFSGLRFQIPKTSKLLDKFNKKIDNSFKGVTRTLKMLRLMITRMILRQLISNATEGFKNLVMYSDEANKSFSLIRNSFKQAGNALGAMVSPLLNSLAPAINYVIQLFIKATNAVNQFLAALTGRNTWTKATQLTEDYRESVAGAAKAQKDFTMGIDELNILNDSSGGGSGSSTNYADMFEEVKVDSFFKDLANSFKEFFAPLEKDFERIKKAFSSIWEDIKIGDWFKVGGDVSDLAISIFDLLSNALKLVPWYDIGVKIGEFFNGIKWKDVLKSFGNFLKTILDSGVDLLKGVWDANPLVGAIVTAIIGVGAYKKIIGALFGTSVAATAGGGLLGSLLPAGVVAFLRKIGLGMAGILAAGVGGYFLGNRLGKLLFPDDAEWYDYCLKHPVETFKTVWKTFVSGEWKAVVKEMMKGWDWEEALRPLLDVMELFPNHTLFGGIDFDEVRKKLSGEADDFNALASTAEYSLSKIDNIANNTIGSVKNSFNTLSSSLGVVDSNFSLVSSNSARYMNTYQTNISKGCTKIESSLGSISDTVDIVFSEETWTTDGVAKGMNNTFTQAVNEIKGIWNPFADELNEKMKIDISNGVGIGLNAAMGKIAIGKVGKFINGGFPEDGLFFANHNELVGSFSNGRTAVANNEQIVAGIEGGVERAVSRILAPTLVQIANNTRETANKDFSVSIGDRDIARANKRGNRSLGRTIITQA